jgi:hypothetical protein
VELVYWQSVAALASVTAVLALVLLAAVAWADHATYRRGR